MKPRIKSTGDILVAIGGIVFALGLFLWGYQVVWPAWQFSVRDADGDGVVLAETLSTTPTRSPKPTFTPRPTATAEAPPETLPDFPAAAESGATSLETVEVPTPVRVARPRPTEPPLPARPPPAERPPDRILIPSIGVDAPVEVMGWVTRQDASGNFYSEWVIPDYAAGWHKNSALPGHVGNTVLSGHNNIKGEVFRYLADVEPGAEVVLYVGETAYRYIVTEKYIVKEKGVPYEQRLKNARFMAPTDDERVTLISCWPYTNNTHRVIVIAKPAALVSGGE